MIWVQIRPSRNRIRKPDELFARGEMQGEAASHNLSPKIDSQAI